MDYQYLLDEKKRHIDLIERFMQQVVTHEDMKEYIDKINQDLEVVKDFKDKESEERWKSWEAAFGGKELSDD